jgi:hypothetical protein
VATSAVTIVSWSATKYVTVELLEPDGRMVRRKIGRADIVSYVTEAERRRAAKADYREEGDPAHLPSSSKLLLAPGG